MGSYSKRKPWEHRGYRTRRNFMDNFAWWLCLVTDWCDSCKREYISVRRVTGSCVLWNTGSWEMISTCVGTGWEEGPVAHPYWAGLQPLGFLDFKSMFIVLALGMFFVTAFRSQTCFVRLPKKKKPKDSHTSGKYCCVAPCHPSEERWCEAPERWRGEKLYQVASWRPGFLL